MKEIFQQLTNCEKIVIDILEQTVNLLEQYDQILKYPKQDNQAFQLQQQWKSKCQFIQKQMNNLENQLNEIFEQYMNQKVKCDLSTTNIQILQKETKLAILQQNIVQLKQMTQNICDKEFP